MSLDALTTLSEIMNAAYRVMIFDWTSQTKDRVRFLGRSYVRQLNRYAKVCASKKGPQAGARAYHLSNSYAARFCNFLLAYPNSGPTLKLGQVEAAAVLVHPRKPSGETVHAWTKDKPEGGFRILAAFGPLSRAAQNLVLAILRPSWGISPYEYSRKGRGRDAALRSALHDYEHGGVRRWVLADILNCYPSVSQEALFKIIPLPESMIRNIILIPSETNISLKSNPHSLSFGTVLSGLPMGSLIAPYIMSKLLEHVLADLAMAPAICHGDNILLGVGDDEKAAIATGTLASRLAEHPAGPFKLKEVETIRRESDHDFLGYRIRRRKPPYAGEVRASVSNKAIRRFQRRTAGKIALLPWGTWADVVERRAESWAESMGEWGGRGHGVDIAVVEFVKRVYPVVTAFQRHIHGVGCKGFVELAALQAKFDQIWLPLIDHGPEKNVPMMHDKQAWAAWKARFQAGLV
jgi:hypothetical protein